MSKSETVENESKNVARNERDNGRDGGQLFMGVYPSSARRPGVSQPRQDSPGGRAACLAPFSEGQRSEI